MPIHSHRTTLRTSAALFAGLATSCIIIDVPEDLEGYKVPEGIDDPGVEGGFGVGDACDDSAQCRPGLLCEGGECAPGYSQAEGDPCVISAECEVGLYCEAGQCAPAGSGESGDVCATDADCASGFRCAVSGFFGVCMPEGDGDVGDACQTSLDCYSGLGCADGVCAPGAPPFGEPWPGAECPVEPATAVAHFTLPNQRGGDFYQLPFPNDIRTAAGHPDLTQHPTPGNGLGVDVVDRYLRAVESGTDGFGLYSTAIFRFSQPIDADSFADRIEYIDLTDQRSLGFYLSYRDTRSAYVCENWLAVRRPTGGPLPSGHTYAVLVHQGVRTKSGSDVKATDDFTAMLAAQAPSDTGKKAAWERYAPLRTHLATTGASAPLNAAVFTTGNPRSAVAAAAATTKAGAIPSASGYVECDTGVASPCPDATGDRGCSAADPAFHEIHALVSLPIHQQGKAPYIQPKDGGAIGPDPVRYEQVCVSMTVPRGAAPAGGWPTLVYAHGTGGSFRSHVNIGRKFATGVDNGTGTIVQAAVVGFDQVAHGPRKAGSQLSSELLFFNVENPLAARGNVQQGAIDQLAIALWIPTVSFDGSSSPTGEAFGLSPIIALWGHSQGATHGGVALPYAAWTGALFTGHGGGLMHTLLGKHSPLDIAALVPFALQDAGSDGKLAGGIYNPMLSLFQTYFDASDPIAYAGAFSDSNLPAPHQLQMYGFDDTYSPGASQAAYAKAAKLTLVASESPTAEQNYLDTSAAASAPLSGNRLAGGVPTTWAVRQYQPPTDVDGHFVGTKDAMATADGLRFLAGALSDITPIIGE